MAKKFEGSFIGKGKKFAIVVSRFNQFITNRLLEEAFDTLIRHEVSDEDIEIIWTPGSFEIPPVARRLADSERYDAVICLGVILRGDTSHFEHISSQVAKGIAEVALSSKIPTIFGIITAETIEQAIERAGVKQGNRGKDAAIHALEMANLYQKI